MDELHTYMVWTWRMTVGSPLTFSDGERIVAVLSSKPTPGLSSDIDVTVLVELPLPPEPVKPIRLIEMEPKTRP